VNGWFDQVAPPHHLPRTATDRLREAVWDQRARAASQPREIRLPVTAPPGHRLVGCPPAGMFRITEEQR
jgi:hypothetical protein